jgi:hypothetical protein
VDVGRLQSVSLGPKDRIGYASAASKELGSTVNDPNAPQHTRCRRAFELRSLANRFQPFPSAATRSDLSSVWRPKSLADLPGGVRLAQRLGSTRRTRG